MRIRRLGPILLLACLATTTASAAAPSMPNDAIIMVDSGCGSARLADLQGAMIGN